jgi:hypothetical protein
MQLNVGKMFSFPVVFVQCHGLCGGSKSCALSMQWERCAVTRNDTIVDPVRQIHCEAGTGEAVFDPQVAEQSGHRQRTL